MFGTLRDIATRIGIVARPKITSKQTAEEKIQDMVSELVGDIIDGSSEFKSIQSANTSLVTKGIVKFLLDSHPNILNQSEQVTKILINSDGMKRLVVDVLLEFQAPKHEDEQRIKLLIEELRISSMKVIKSGKVDMNWIDSTCADIVTWGGCEEEKLRFGDSIRQALPGNLFKVHKERLCMKFPQIFRP